MENATEKIRRLEADLEVAKLRLVGGVNATNIGVDLTPTVEESFHLIVLSYHDVLRRLAE